MKTDNKYREIPYNYTSFSDKEIIIKYFDEETWGIINRLRSERVTGRSARLLFEILGDIFIIDRNPYIYNDFLDNPRKQRKLVRQHRKKFSAIAGIPHSDMVETLIIKAREADSAFFEALRHEKRERGRIAHALKKATASGNIHFSAFHRVSHVTDATDWRMEYPRVVVYPEGLSEIPALVRRAKKAGLTIIPRGAGTGLTGGAVPTRRDTMVLNTEKLRGIYGIETVHEEGKDIPVVEVETGAITGTVIDYCAERGYVFATDPTSSWASTIGGNIAENSGGKKCVMWGTAIDNIYSFRLVDAEGAILQIKRRGHPYRKILPEDSVTFDIFREGNDNEILKSITLSGTEIRKKGVGKDITNKALGGVPGIQKEGGDGVIISARFVLYRPFSCQDTVCCEFFGRDLVKASQAIIEILRLFDTDEKCFLTALEHFDEKYEAAINYRNKSDRPELPKAVLLIDIEGNDRDALDNATHGLIELVKKYNAEGFIARDEAMKNLFWSDRKNLGAIAKHTNAFKLNEDIVIPIKALPAFADFIEMLNITRELENYIELIAKIKELFSGPDPDAGGDTFLEQKKAIFINQLDETGMLLALYAENIMTPVSSLPDGEYPKTDARPLFEYLRDEGTIPDKERFTIESFEKLFHGYRALIARVNSLYRKVKSRKIVIATHMHAGDGNIHVNIPVHSNDYPMMQSAAQTVDTIMEKTKALDGVISGEHGIGLTKIKYIDPGILDEYKKYKETSDPENVFNPGKLSADTPYWQIYTPSFNLLGMEAFILESSDLEELSGIIAPCVRCGKCKEVCNTHYPEAGMFYSPRNKILAVSLIIEAVLYEVQTQNSLSVRNFTMLRDIADHCTVCHNCFAPCPAGIDFGDVTLASKKLLVERKRAKFKLTTGLVLFYLKRRGYMVNKIFRVALLKYAYAFQRAGYHIIKPVHRITSRFLPWISGMLASPLPKTGKKSIREIFGLTGDDSFYAFSRSDGEIKKSVVYFPGCGSERMFPEISAAVIALLYNAGVRVVIPPDYLCCGYPLMFNGRVKEAKQKSDENRVIFHRMSATVGYMNIEDIVVSCGTCYEMLDKYHLENIFPGAGLIDINEFIVREGLYPAGAVQDSPLYHEPCHTPLKHLGAEKTFSALFNTVPVTVPNCCGEGGTLSISTPGISNDLRERKKINIMRFVKGKKKQGVTVLTTCPSCVQGLSRITGPAPVTGKSVAVYAAELFLGKGWKKKFIHEVKKGNGIEKIIM